MLRRRLRMVSSSDEEEEDEQRQQQQQQQHHHHQEEVEAEEDDAIEVDPQEQEPIVNLGTETLSSSNPNPDPSEPVQISDDEFVDVSENLPPPSPPEPPIPEQSFQFSSGSGSGGANSFESSDCPISDFLRRLGLRLRREWLDSCVHGLESSIPGFSSLDVSGKAKLCFEQFLYSDMNYSGSGVLPENVHDMHLVDLSGPFVLQVDEIVNISCPLRNRYQKAPSGVKRCLKLSMTDGVQRVFGMEYRPIKDLEVLAPAGMKVAICNVNVRRGILMLVPEVFEVLGGLVEELEAARQRLVHEVNKPPRGKRTRNGVRPPLAARATLAAWSQDHVSESGHNNNSTSQAATPFQADNQAPRASSAEWTQNRVSESRHNNNSTSQAATSFRADSQGTAATVPTSAGTTEGFAVAITGEPNPSSSAVLNFEEIHIVDDVEHPFILSGDREIPFTYLASLLAEWAAMKDKAPNVQGRIKCFLTGVKGFQYKKRTAFELRVYVDDGSLISEILIDHNVVQKGIGYSPEEVTAALTSSDAKRVSDMKETLKQFQIFLVNFEGTMLVQISEASPLPVAIEVNQGCPASDAWLLLRRLKSPDSDRPPQHPNPDPINLSP